MYAFKVFVSTLILILMFFVFWAGLKGDKGTKVSAAIVSFVYTLAIIAIWG